ncbi:kinase-like protein, partial [Glonium stellatum]
MPDENVTHEVYANKSEIPFVHLENLGYGRFGVVDKVERSYSKDNEVYARKTIRTSYYNSQKQMEKIMAEIKIVRKLQHPHIVNVVATYQANREFGIIMQPVADMDLGEYLAETDSLPEGAPSNLEWLARCNRLKRWMRCLVQAMEYIHGERIRHKDLKPANILVQGENIHITDFGVAKDLMDEATTASLGTLGERGTPMYCAPELYSEGQRRGRATDMFSLGCITLEMVT